MDQGTQSTLKSALYNPAAALEQLRGIVGNATALLIQVAAFVKQIPACIRNRRAGTASVPADIPARVLAGLRGVQQSDRRANCRAGDEPNHFSGVVLCHAFILLSIS